MEGRIGISLFRTPIPGALVGFPLGSIGGPACGAWTSGLGVFALGDFVGKIQKNQVGESFPFFGTIDFGNMGLLSGLSDYG